jgi:hypothetical protein
MTIPRRFDYGRSMIRIFRMLAATLALSGYCASALGQTKEGAPSAPLSAEEISGAVKLDSVTVPTPGELLAAIDKLGKPDWASEFRPPIATNYASRARMALNIGGLIADGYIAVEAEDAQMVKNIGKDMINLAKPLGVQQELLNRGKTLTEFAEHGQWSTLKEEFEATQNEVKKAMGANKDDDLVTLVTVGGWLRGFSAMADYVAKHYSADGAKMLRQPAVVHLLNERVNALPDKIKEEAPVRHLRTVMGGIETALSFAPNMPPNQETLAQLSKITSEMLKEIAQKK